MKVLKETELIAKLAQAIADNGDDLMVMVSADDRKKLRDLETPLITLYTGLRA